MSFQVLSESFGNVSNNYLRRFLGNCVKLYQIKYSPKINFILHELPKKNSKTNPKNLIVMSGAKLSGAIFLPMLRGDFVEGNWQDQCNVK